MTTGRTINVKHNIRHNVIAYTKDLVFEWTLCFIYYNSIDNSSITLLLATNIVQWVTFNNALLDET